MSFQPNRKPPIEIDITTGTGTIAAGWANLTAYVIGSGEAEVWGLKVFGGGPAINIGKTLGLTNPQIGYDIGTADRLIIQYFTN